MREEAEGISLFLQLGQINIKEYAKNNIIIKPQREIKGIMRVENEGNFPFSPAGASKHVRVVKHNKYFL